MTKIEIPEHLKESLPRNLWGKVLGATPIVMTVIATVLAGLATNEMTRAQYDRAWAAQLQSKASDEWGYFQAKRMRSILQGDVLDVFETVAAAELDETRPLGPVLLGILGDRPADPSRERAWAAARAWAQSPQARTAIASLEAPKFPSPAAGPRPDRYVEKAIRAVESGRPEDEIEALIAGIDEKSLENALRVAQDRLADFDQEAKPVAQWADGMEKRLAAAGARPSPELKALRLRYDSLRYEAESRFDQRVGYVYELEVRRANFTSDRHRVRSQRFFVGMLGAQMAVVIATFALAARQKSLLWLFAAAAGVAAVFFALYVYLFI